MFIVQGTGPGGRIVKADVEAVISGVMDIAGSPKSAKVSPVSIFIPVPAVPTLPLL